MVVTSKARGAIQESCWEQYALDAFCSSSYAHGSKSQIEIEPHIWKSLQNLINWTGKRHVMYSKRNRDKKQQTQTDKQTDRETDREIDRQTDRWLLAEGRQRNMTTASKSEKSTCQNASSNHSVSH